MNITRRILFLVLFVASAAARGGDFGFPSADSERPYVGPVKNPPFNLFTDFRTRLQTAINSGSAAAIMLLYQTNGVAAQELNSELSRWQRVIGEGTNTFGIYYKDLNTLPSEARKIWTAEAHRLTQHEVTHLAFVRVNGVSLALPLVIVHDKLLIMPSEKIATNVRRF